MSDTYPKMLGLFHEDVNDLIGTKHNRVTLRNKAEVIDFIETQVISYVKLFLYVVKWNKTFNEFIPKHIFKKEAVRLGLSHLGEDYLGTIFTKMTYLNFEIAEAMLEKEEPC